MNSPIGWMGFAAGVEAVGLSSSKPLAALLPGAERRYLYRVRVPAGAAISLNGISLSGPPPGNGQPGSADPDVARALRHGQDLLLPFGALSAVHIDKVYRPGSMFATVSDHPLVGRRLSELHRPAQVPGLANIPQDGATLAALDPVVMSAATAAGLFAATPQRERWRYSDRPDWDTVPLVRFDATDSRIAFEHGLLPANVYDIDVIRHLRDGGRPAGGLLSWDRTVLRQPLRAGGFAYAAYLPGGIDPHRTLPWLPDTRELTAQLGDQLPAVLTPGGVRYRHIAGCFPVLGVDEATGNPGDKRVVVGGWRTNPSFGGLELLGTQVDAAAAVRRALTLAGYVIEERRSEPAMDPRTVGAGFGLFSKQVLDWYAVQAHRVAVEMAQTPPQAWLTELQRLVNELSERAGWLDGVGVPPARLRYTDKAPGPGEHFDPKQWSIALIRSPQPPDRTAMCGLLHRVRHAEQSFLVARLMAGWGGEPVDLARRTGSPHGEMLRRALANPLLPGQPQYDAAVEWWYTGHGLGSGRVSAVARNLTAATVAQESARKAYGRAVTAGTGSVPARAALWAARKSLSAAEERYRSLPVEADALAVEEVVRARWQAPQRDWRRSGAVPPLRVPSGYQLTRTGSGLHIRRSGTSVPAPVHVGHPMRLRLTVDPDMGAMQAPDLPAVLDLLDSMPYTAVAGRVVVDVGPGPALSPQDAAGLAERIHGQRGATSGAVAVPSTRLTERPAPSERVVPLDTRARPTSRDLAVEYLFLPEGAPREFDPDPPGMAGAVATGPEDGEALRPHSAPPAARIGTRPTEPSQQPTTDELTAAYATVQDFETRRDNLVTARAERPGAPGSTGPADLDRLYPAYRRVVAHLRAQLDARKDADTFRATNLAADMATQTIQRRLAEPRTVEALARISDGYRRLVDALAGATGATAATADSSRPAPGRDDHLPATAWPAPDVSGSPHAFGLASPEAVGWFAKESVAVARDIADEPPERRVARMAQLLDELLARAGVPQPMVRLEPGLEGDARLDAPAWTISFRPHGNDDFTVLETLFHQARHAEQMFVALRWQAGRGPLGRLRLLLRRPQVNREVLSAARASPLRQDSPAQRAAGALWWRAWFGPETSATSTAVGALGLAAKQYRRAHEEYREVVATGAAAASRRAAKNSLWRGRYELILRYEEYQKLLVEQDAYLAMRQVRRMWADAAPPMWLRPLESEPVAAPSGHELTRTGAGLYLRREQAGERTRRIDVSQWGMHPHGMRLTVDPNVIDWDAVYQVLDVLPLAVDEVARWPILHLPGTKMMAPVDAQSLAGRHMGARGSRGPVAIPAAMLTRRPAASERVVPLDDRMRVASPEWAAEYLFFPPGLPAPHPVYVGYWPAVAVAQPDTADVPGSAGGADRSPLAAVSPGAATATRAGASVDAPATGFGPATVGATALGRPTQPPGVADAGDSRLAVASPDAGAQAIGVARSAGDAPSVARGRVLVPVPGAAPVRESATPPVPAGRDVGTAAQVAIAPAIMQLDSMVRVSGSLGSRRGGVFADPAGRQWYVKAARSRLHAENELLAARFYELFGLGTTGPQLIALDQRLGGGFGVASLRVPHAVTLGAAGGVDRLTEAQLNEIWRGFGIDAWLANWSLAGPGYTNILLTNTAVLRIGFGSALLFKAGGRLKGSDRFSVVVAEVDTFKAAWRHPYAAALFAGMPKLTETASALPVVGLTAARIGELVHRVISDRARAEALSEVLVDRKDDLAGNYGGVLYRKSSAPLADPEAQYRTATEIAGAGGALPAGTTGSGTAQIGGTGGGIIDTGLGPAGGRHRRSADETDETDDEMTETAAGNSDRVSAYANHAHRAEQIVADPVVGPYPQSLPLTSTPTAASVGLATMPAANAGDPKDPTFLAAAFGVLPGRLADLPTRIAAQRLVELALDEEWHPRPGAARPALAADHLTRRLVRLAAEAGVDGDEQPAEASEQLAPRLLLDAATLVVNVYGEAPGGVRRLAAMWQLMQLAAPQGVPGDAPYPIALLEELAGTFDDQPGSRPTVAWLVEAVEQAADPAGSPAGGPAAGAIMVDALRAHWRETAAIARQTQSMKDLAEMSSPRQLAHRYVQARAAVLVSSGDVAALDGLWQEFNDGYAYARQLADPVAFPEREGVDESGIVNAAADAAVPPYRALLRAVDAASDAWKPDGQLPTEAAYEAAGSDTPAGELAERLVVQVPEDTLAQWRLFSQAMAEGWRRLAEGADDETDHQAAGYYAIWELFHREFAEVAGVLRAFGRPPSDDDLLPLVRSVLDPGAPAVTGGHLHDLAAYTVAVAAERTPTVAALRHHIQFVGLRQRLIESWLPDGFVPGLGPDPGESVLDWELRLQAAGLSLELAEGEGLDPTDTDLRSRLLSVLRLAYQYDRHGEHGILAGPFSLPGLLPVIQHLLGPEVESVTSAELDQVASVVSGLAANSGQDQAMLEEVGRVFAARVPAASSPATTSAPPGHRHGRFDGREAQSPGELAVGRDRYEEPRVDVGDRATPDASSVAPGPDLHEATKYADEIERLWSRVNDRMRLLPVSMRGPFDDGLNDIEVLLELVPGPNEQGQWQQMGGEQLRLLRQARDELTSLAQRLFGDVILGSFPEDLFPEAASLLDEALREHSESLAGYLDQLDGERRTGYGEWFDRIHRELAESLAELRQDAELAAGPDGGITPQDKVRTERRAYEHTLAAYEQLQEMRDALDREPTP